MLATELEPKKEGDLARTARTNTNTINSMNRCERFRILRISTFLNGYAIWSDDSTCQLRMQILLTFFPEMLDCQRIRKSQLLRYRGDLCILFAFSKFDVNQHTDR